MLKNGFGEHNIQGIGDKHVPLIHNVMNTDYVVDISDKATDNLNLVFNTNIGKEYLIKKIDSIYNFFFVQMIITALLFTVITFFEKQFLYQFLVITPEWNETVLSGVLITGILATFVAIFIMVLAIFIVILFIFWAVLSIFRLILQSLIKSII